VCLAVICEALKRLKLRPKKSMDRPCVARGLFQIG
jgi:hypothetical protein